MVSNFDRIFAAIKREAKTVASDRGLDTDALVEILMAIVDTEDQYLRKTLPRINQIVEDKIYDTAVAQMNKEDSSC